MSPASSSRLDAGAVALMLLLCACWGFNQVAIKLATEGISPLFQAGLRSAGSGLLLWAWSHARGVRLFLRDGTLPLGILIGVMFAAEFVFLYRGIVWTTASSAVLFLYTAPFVVALGAHFFVGRTPAPAPGRGSRLGLRRDRYRVCCPRQARPSATAWC